MKKAAGNRAGCHTILVDLGTEQAPEQVVRQPTFVAYNMLHALRIIDTISLLEREINFLYRPSAWLEYKRM